MRDTVPKKAAKDYTAEGLRGLAALNVFFSHFFLVFFPLGFDKLFPGLQTSPAYNGAMEHFLRLPFISILWNGNFAVCVFFALSGFVLSKPYYDGPGLESLRDRYLKRYLRLSVPIAGSILIGFLLLKLGWLRNLDAAALTHSDWYRQYFTFIPTWPGAVQDMLYRSIFLGETRYNPPLWTMRLEFVGSLLTFAFYTLMPHGNWRKVLHYAIALVCIGFFAQKDAIYYFAFLAGGLIWVLPRPRSNAFVLLTVTAIFFGAYQFSAPFTWLPNPVLYEIKAFYNVLGAFLLLWALRSGYCDGVLASAPMRNLGRMSFSFYLTHFFVIGTFSCWFYLQWAARWPRAAVTSLDCIFSLLLALAAAHFFELFVDRRGIEWSKRLLGAPVPAQA